MGEYIFRGTVELSGVDFYVTADTAEEAIQKAKRGEYDDYKTAGAETINWKIDPNTCEDNS